MYNAFFAEPAWTTSLGIYTCYVTLNGSITKQSSVDFSSGKENTSSNYVLMRVSNVPVADIAKSCKKYGYDVFMDDSVAKSVPLRETERAYFPVCPSIQINNQSIAVCKPWISRQGCFSLTTDNIGMAVDCRSIKIATWNKSLPLIGMTVWTNHPLATGWTVGSCYLLDGDVRKSHPKVPDTYCSTDKDFNNFQEDNRGVFLTLFSIININPENTADINSDCVATYMDLETLKLFEMPCHRFCDAYCTSHDGSSIINLNRHMKWEDARKECLMLNKSLPNENFTFSDPTQFDITSTVCLDVFKNSSVLFQPVVKLASKEHGRIIINASTNHSMRLQYLCGTKIETSTTDRQRDRQFHQKDTEESNYGHCNTTTEGFHEFHTRDTTVTWKFPTEMNRIKVICKVFLLNFAKRFNIWSSNMLRCWSFDDSKYACFITRVLKRKGNQEKSSTTEEIVTSDLYSEPVSASGEKNMKTKDHITAEDESAYSVADSNDNEYSQPLVNRDNRTGQVRSANDVTISDSEYADTDLGEYDVLRGQRKKHSENTSSNCDIYDRTNNVVTGIYDVTTNTLNENEYSMTDNDLNQ
ncbi:uncharacterized protein LOC134282910 [Saccostrea cucullata]|uniref:uncharacterized protein LOC134282910 n=1 Tax=Saccostrea cuccullata TaxID=36930 RepID=UPI002ED29BFD